MLKLEFDSKHIATARMPKYFMYALSLIA